jgi:hypothetical protein
MTTTRGSAHYAGLLPVEPSYEPPPICRITLENDPLPNRQQPLRKRASLVLSRFLIAFCIGVAATLTWQSYGDATRQRIANSYSQLGWLAPQRALAAREAPDTIAASAVSYPDQPYALLRDLHAMQQSLDRFVAGQEQMTRRTDQTTKSIAAGQEPTTRRANQTAATITTGQGQMRRNTDQAASSVDQTRSAKAITVESRGDAASLHETLRLNIKPTEAKPPQTSSERDKQRSSTSGHDASCFPSASAVLQNYPGGLPSWTLRAPGHEGTLCWHAPTRPKGSDDRPRPGDHRREIMAKGTETNATTENGLFALPARYAMPPE